MKDILKKLEMDGKTIGQFCCNNGRELLSLVKCGNAAKGIGFDIAENQVAFANEKAKELNLPCIFEAVNIYDIDDRYKEQFDFVLITIGALCWFQDLNRFFAIVSKCMKPGAVILINEQHPLTNMLATEGEEPYDPGQKWNAVILILIMNGLKTRECITLHRKPTIQRHLQIIRIQCLRS